MMENTFTYTARGREHPERVVTFTLYDHHMSVDLGGLMEHVERALRHEPEESEQTDGKAKEREQEEADELEVGEAQASPSRSPALAVIKPAAVSALERGTGPFHVRDVAADVDGDSFRVRTWIRAKGLRAAPVQFSWQSVDNPEGARAFTAELGHRQRAASHPGRFPGPMDYWLSWLVLGGLVLALFWSRRRGGEQAGE
jgi:hypothetical protein